MKHRSVLLCVLLSTLPVAAIEKADLENEVRKRSYALGANYGTSLSSLSLEFDVDTFVEGLKAGLAGSSLLSPEEIDLVMRAVSAEARAARNRQQQELSMKNLSEGQAFLAANGEKEGVVTLESGLQYRVISEGTGDTGPGAADRVEVHYHGTLIDGTVFDSSRDRGQPAIFGVDQVIRGWTEALQLMKEGDRWELFIPSGLAYGERGSRPRIGPNAVLVFDVELISVLPRPLPPPRPPVTSDIIRVPSKEEMEKGEQIEVIKADQVEAYRERLRKEKEEAEGEENEEGEEGAPESDSDSDSGEGDDPEPDGS